MDHKSEAYRESLDAYHALNKALTAAGLPFHFAGFNVVEDTGHPTFTVRMTTTQAGLLADALTAPKAEPKVQVLHQRDPDSECDMRVFLGGVEVSQVVEVESLDPGAGYEKETYEENVQRAETAANKPDATDYDRAVLEAWEEMETSYERWSTDWS